MKNILVIVVLFIVLQVIHAEKIGVLPELSRPNQVDLIDGMISVADGANIYLYEKSSLKLIRYFGKEGQGPGEFTSHPERSLLFDIFDGKFFLNSANKFAFFSKDGQLKYEKVIPFFCLQAMQFGENYILTRLAPNKKGERVVYVSLYDKNLNELQVMLESLRPNPWKDRKIELPPKHAFVRCYEGNAYLCDCAAPGLRILRFNEKGRRVQTIDVPVEKIEVGEDFKRDALAWLKSLPHLRALPIDPAKMVYFPDYFPAVRNILFDNGRIFVQTFFQKNGFSKFLVLDLKGNIQKEIYLPCGNRDIIQLDPIPSFTIRDNVYYYLMEEVDSEDWELHSMKLDKVPGQ